MGSAEKLGRFIPCRGGGTTTTYYTDYHDVDEDMRTFTYQGCDWIPGSGAGITIRYLYSIPTEAWDGVASRLIYLS